MSSCPSCAHTNLKHTLISETLPAHTCPTCDGILISLVAYRRWREAQEPSTPRQDTPDSVSVDDSAEAIACSKCKKLMTKYRISAETPNRIDFCAGCEDIWLDSGEWHLVEALAGSDHLANILTQPWQRRIRHETIEKMEHERLTTLLGDDFDKVVAMSDWLTGHASRDLILTYLQSKSR